MATKPLVPVEEYLRTSFDGPDREYLDGEIVERNVGENQHSEVQARRQVRRLRIPQPVRRLAFARVRADWRFPGRGPALRV